MSEDHGPSRELLRVTTAYFAEHPRSERVRLYILESGPAAPGSFSSSWGDGPGSWDRRAPARKPDPGKFYSLPEILALKRASEPGRDEAHVLTIDLQEIPELSKRYPGARALSLFAPKAAIESGEPWEDARLVPVPATATAPASGQALVVTPVEVPTTIFDAKEDALTDEIRRLVLNAPGRVLGGPISLQDGLEGVEGFVMQLSDAIGELNLGDSGALYVFEATTHMQCL